jgi:uncharacterized protein (UPF0335 family)
MIKTQTEMGHNSTGADNVVGAELLAFIERIERIEAERKDLAGDKSEVFQEAKGRGFDVPVMKDIIKQRAKDPSERSEFETVLDLYQTAIAKAAGGRA